MSRLRVAVIRGRATDGVAASRRAAGRVGGLVPSAETSVAHSGPAGAAARVPDGWRVGVDLERAGAVNAEELRYFLTEDEAQASADLDATSVWCLKEAAWKALGCAHTLRFKSLELRFVRDDHGVRVAALRVDDHDAVPAQCAVRLIGHTWIVASVAVRASDVAALSAHAPVARWPLLRGGAHAS